MDIFRVSLKISFVFSSAESPIDGNLLKALRSLGGLLLRLAAAASAC